MRILVRRIGALGDVILITPIVRRLRRENPDAEIAVQTAYPDVFRDSPYRLAAVLPPGSLPYPWTLEGGCDRTISLDMIYENYPLMHVVQAYMSYAFGDFGDPADLQQEIALDPKSNWHLGANIVAVHAAKAGWRNRTLPEATWRLVIIGLKSAGLRPILVGTGRDTLLGAGCPSAFGGDLRMQTGLISRSACFVGSDSALLHAAASTDVPIVGVFTCADPLTRLAWRHGELGWRAEVVVPDLDCVGCLTRAPAPTTVETCERGDVACVTAVSANAIVAAVLRQVEIGKVA